MTESAGPRFGETLRRLRGEAKMTQEALAEQAGYSTVYISMLERGRRDPTPETVAALAGALGLQPAQRRALLVVAGTDALPPSELAGREREQTVLARHLEGDGPPLLLLAGEPGIGKSALLRWAAAQSELRGARILTGEARRGPTESHAPVGEAVRRTIAALGPDELSRRLEGCAWLVRLLPDLSELPLERLPAWSIAPDTERRLVAEAVVRFIGNCSPSVMLLDDLHWAGRDALDLLTVITRAASATSTRLVCTYRDTDVDRRHPLTEWLADLAHAQLVRPLPIGPLDPGAAAGLLDRELGPDRALGAALRDDLVRRSGGVPFFLVSCAQAVRDQSPEARAVPWTVAQSVRQRISMLPEGAEVALLALAVTAPAEVELVQHVADAELEQAVTILESATDRGLVTERGGYYTFVHDLIREVVEAGSSGARRALLHRRAAEYLERAPEPIAVERLVRHLVRGGLRERAIPYLERAGEEARRRYATSAAAGYFRELVDTLEALGRRSEAAAAGERLAESLALATRYDEALGVLAGVEQHYAELGDSEGVWRAVAQITRIHATRGTADEGIRRLRPVVPEERHEFSGGLARLFTSLARLHFVRGEYAEQIEAAEEGVRHARGVGDDALLVDALNVRSAGLGMLGRIPESLEAYAEVIRLGTEAGMPEIVQSALGNTAATYLERGQLRLARPYIERGLAIVERIGDSAHIPYFRAMRGEVAFYTGDWAAARADLERARASLQGTTRNVITGQTLVTLGHLLLAAGETDAAVAVLEESLLTEEIQAIRGAQPLLAEHDIDAGRPQRAIDRLTPYLDRAGVEEWDVTPLYTVLARAHLSLGHHERAREFAGTAVRRARVQEFGLALVDALRVYALVQDRDGNADGAIASLDEAMVLARGMPYPLGEAQALRERARIEQGRGNGAEAAALAAAARRIEDRLRPSGEGHDS